MSIRNENPSNPSALSSSLPAWSRRQFLASLGLTAALGTSSLAWAESETTPASLTEAAAEAARRPVDPNHFVLLSDTHCAPSLKHQSDFMRKSISDILAMNPRPAHVLIYGDFAFLYGKLEDYVFLRELMAPLDAAGIPWTTCMGNHDRRETFSEIFPEHAAQSLLSDRLVFRVEAPSVDFLLLDSLIEPPETTRWITPGEILDDQKDWLNETLKAQTKPVILGAHHLLNETKLVDLIKSHSCVAGYLNGHNHYWKPISWDGIPNLTLPSNGHWGDIGFVNARLTQKKVDFHLVIRDFLIMNRAPEFEPNVLRKSRLAELQGASWTLNLG